MEIQLNDKKLSDHDDSESSATTGSCNSSEVPAISIKDQQEFLTKLLQQRNQRGSPSPGPHRTDRGKGQSEFFKKIKGEGGTSPAPTRKSAACKRVVQKPKEDGMMKKSKPAMTGFKGKQAGPPVSIIYSETLSHRAFALIR